MVLRIHPVADLTAGPEAPASEPETAEIAGVAEHVPPTEAVLALVVDVRRQVSPGSWATPAHLSGQGNTLVVYQTPALQDAVASYLEKMRASLRR